MSIPLPPDDWHELVDFPSKTWPAQQPLARIHRQEFGRFRILPQPEIDRRVLATIYLPSDVVLADMTHPTVLGMFGMTAEASAGETATAYSVTQQWASRLRAAQLAGVRADVGGNGMTPHQSRTAGSACCPSGRVSRIWSTPIRPSRKAIRPPVR